MHNSARSQDKSLDSWRLYMNRGKKPRARTLWWEKSSCMHKALLRALIQFISAEDVDISDLMRKMLKHWLQTAVNSHPTISCCQKIKPWDHSCCLATLYMCGKYTLFHESPKKVVQRITPGRSNEKTGNIMRMHKQCVPDLSSGAGTWERG